MSSLKLPNFPTEKERKKISKNKKVKKNDNQILKNIGRNVRAFRKLNNLTIDELSKKSSLSSAYLYALEKNYQNISVTHLKDIAKVFSIKMYILLLDEKYINETIEIYKKLKKYSYKELLNIEKLIEEKIANKSD